MSAPLPSSAFWQRWKSEAATQKKTTLKSTISFLAATSFTFLNNGAASLSHPRSWTSSSWSGSGWGTWRQRGPCGTSQVWPECPQPCSLLSTESCPQIRVRGREIMSVPPYRSNRRTGSQVWHNTIITTITSLYMNTCVITRYVCYVCSPAFLLPQDHFPFRFHTNKQNAN